MRKKVRTLITGLIVLKAMTVPLYAQIQADWKSFLDPAASNHAAVPGLSEFARARRLERKKVAKQLNQEQRLEQLSPLLSSATPPVSALDNIFSDQPLNNAFVTKEGKERPGNTALDTETSLRGNTIPVVKLKSLRLEAASDCQVLVAASAFNDGSTDADGDELIFTFFEDGSEERSFSLGDHTIEIEVYDGKNYVRSTTTLKVEDKTAPTAITKNLSLELNASGVASLSAEEINDGSSDSCSSISLSIDKSDFDCSNVGENMVTLTVTDGNGNAATARAIVTVEDKVAPVMAAEYQFSVDENAAQGSLIGLIQATDNCNTLSYYIKAGNIGGAFSINSNNGELKVSDTEALDYESTPQFTLTVEANDNSDHAVATKVVISLNNLNDNVPKVGTSISAAQQIAEDDHYIYTLPEAAFTDADAGDELSYSATNLPEWLRFNQETMVLGGVPLNDHVGSYTITIRATDKAMQYAEQSFELMVVNTNDAPHGIRLSNHELLENEPAGTLVGELSSLDVDAGDEHTYSMVTAAGADDNAYFTIDGSSLVLLRSLNFEEKEFYEVRILTTDQEGATYEESVSIKVSDVDDSEPFLPNLFSPNGDGSNDRFILRAYKLEQVVFSVYTKQGKLVYETTNITEATEKGWDGTSNGKPQPEGTYVWQLSGVQQGGKPLSIEGKNVGSVTLIR